MKKLKKLFSVLIVVVLMAMVLAPLASARLVVTTGASGTLRRANASWSGSNWTLVQAEMHVTTFDKRQFVLRTSFQPFTATTPWMETRGAVNVQSFGRVGI